MFNALALTLPALLALAYMALLYVHHKRTMRAYDKRIRALMLQLNHKHTQLGTMHTKAHAPLDHLPELKPRPEHIEEQLRRDKARLEYLRPHQQVRRDIMHYSGMNTSLRPHEALRQDILRTLR